MTSEPEDIAIRIEGGAVVLVPAVRTSVTTYVLLEREDWFEPELAFVRALLGPGMRALDIGASYGAYALAMAQRVGRAGQVVAFEPAAAIAGYVRRSAAHNGFDWLSVVAAAVGARTGTAQLYGAGPETSSLTGPAATPAQAVAVTTLDDWGGGARIPFDFVKIDVEDAEAQVIAGGSRFFAAQDPLVMLEVRANDRFDFSVLATMAGLGYDAYRLVPGINILVPVEPELIDGRIAPDRMLLNLFCCKQHAARRLEQRGLLATAPHADGAVRGAGIALCEAQPAFRAVADGLRRRGAVAAEPGDARYRAALDLYAAAQAGDPNRRAGCLAAAAAAIADALAAHADVPRMLSAIRILCEAGWSGRAYAQGLRLTDEIAKGTVRLSEPFLAALPRYAAIDVGAERLAGWVAAQVAEAIEDLYAFSSAFDQRGTLDRLATIAHHGFMTARLERRRQLVRLTYEQQATLEPHPLLAECLNAELWMKATRLGR